MKLGKIHSVETLGLADGPGIRTVFFLQGCPLQCKYCHNPDAQSGCGGNAISADEVLRIARRYRPYYQKTGGGVTFSGGEPLMQSEFLLEALTLLKQEGFHTAIDTCGFGPESWMDSILEVTDCVLMDIKATDEATHLELTARPMSGRDAFWKRLANYHGTVWLRHVLVPEFTDHQENLEKLYQLACQIPSVEKLQLLPYHKKGIEKYKRMGLRDPLAGIPEMDPKKAELWEASLMQRLRASREKERLLLCQKSQSVDAKYVKGPLA